MKNKKSDIKANSLNKKELRWKDIKQNFIEVKKEAVNNPSHYGGKDNLYEAIKVIEAWDLDFCLGNTVKYISRAGKKDDTIQDLEKAKWYLERKIQKLKELKK